MAHHLKNNKGRGGAIVKSHATTDLLGVFAENNGLQTIQTPVGFKYLGEEVLDAQKAKNPVLLAGEESGGMTFGEYLPEKDGIVAISLLAELVAKEQKPISKILADIKSDLGVASYSDNISKTINNPDKFAQIQENVKWIFDAETQGIKSAIFKKHGLDLNIEATKAHAATINEYKPGGDGVKFIFGDKSSLLIRKSGTEPKSRGIIEAIETNDVLAKERFERMKAAFTEIMQ
jgi:phosphomannomutase